MSPKPTTKPIVSLAALHGLIVEAIDASERRIAEKVVAVDRQISELAFQVGQIYDRLVGLEDQHTEQGKHLDEVRDALKDQIDDVQRAVDRIDVDQVAGAIRSDLDILADAERRRELQEMRGIRRVV
jgi:hypothetical protein